LGVGLGVGLGLGGFTFWGGCVGVEFLGWVGGGWFLLGVVFYCRKGGSFFWGGSKGWGGMGVLGVFVLSMGWWGGGVGVLSGFSAWNDSTSGASR